MKSLIRGAIFLLLLSLVPASSFAFGKNKVVLHNFRWKVLSTAHFDLHYTAESAPIIARVAEYMEKAHDEVTRNLRIEIKGRTSFFLFNNHNQFEENNVVDVGEGTGGVTEAFKNRLLIFNDGTEFWLQHVIVHEFAHVGQFEILYGGFWKSARLLKSPLYPLWLMEGHAEYVTGDMDEAVEDLYLRDAATSGRLFYLSELHGFNHLKPHQVTLGYKQGGAAIRFLASEYGQENMGDLFVNLRDRFEPHSVIQDMTGQNFRSFDRRYVEFLTDYYAAQAEGTREPSAYGVRVTTSDFLPVFNSNPAISPDGRHMAYLTDRSGNTEVVLYDFQTGRERVLAGRQWRAMENIQGQGFDDGHGLSFSRDGRWLAFIAEKVQKDYLFLYDIKRDRLRRIRTPFEQLRSPVFHPTEDKLTIVAMKNGTNDLYEITPRGKILRRLTNSLADENGPAYSPDGRILAYSQEVLLPPDPRKPGDLPRERDPDMPVLERNLIGLDLVTLSTMTLTDMRGEERQPAFTPDGKSLLFTAEPDKIYNLYRLDLASGGVAKLTNIVTGNFSPEVARDGSFMVFVCQRHGSQQIYRAGPELWNVPLSTATVASVQPSKENWPRLNGGETASTEDQPPLMVVQAPSDKTGPRLPSDKLGPQLAPTVAAREQSPFPFPERSPFVSESHPYRFRLSTDLFFPVLYYSSTDGLFVATLWQMSEHLGNHQLFSSVQYASGSRFIDYGVQYRYARFRPQFFLGAAGKSFYQDFSRTQLRKEYDVFAGVAYPFDRFHRLETAVARAYRTDRYSEFPQLDTLNRENVLSLSFIRDTTTGRYLAVTNGDRFEYTHRIARKQFVTDRSYESSEAEYNRFIPTGRESAVAFRALGGVSYGETPELFRVSGYDRVRGYARNADENKSKGYAVGNLEWRVPLRYMDLYTWFLFPDVYFKAIYGVVFTDAGYDWDHPAYLGPPARRRFRNSVGGGLRIPTFILQTYSVTLSVDVAKRLDSHKWVWYFALGPSF